MTTPQPVAVRLTDEHTAVAVRPARLADLPGAVDALGLAGRPLPVVAVVGGAGGLDERATAALTSLFTGAIAPVIRERGAVAVDGGTDTGVMRLMGRARAAGEPFPLVGVAAVGTVNYPGHRGANPDSAPLEPNHTHFVLAPGAQWGDEAPWLAGVASILAGGGPPALGGRAAVGSRPAVTLLVNGGEISLADARASLAENRPVLVLAGTGRAADRIAAAVSDPAACGDPRIARLAQSPLVRVLDVTDRAAAASRLREALTP